MPDPMPMPAPSSQPTAAESAEQNFHLWRDAPGWRNLVHSAIGFSVALMVLPLVTTSSAVGPDQNVACQVGNAGAFFGLSGRGQVVGFLTPDQANRLLQETQFASHMAINPNYLANVRSLVHIDGSPEGARKVYLVPSGMTVKMGDRVDVAGGHVDPTLPCHYIPNLIVRFAQS